MPIGGGSPGGGRGGGESLGLGSRGVGDRGDRGQAGDMDRHRPGFLLIGGAARSCPAGYRWSQRQNKCVRERRKG